MAQLRKVLVWIAAAMLLAACNRMTPEERLEKVNEAMQQQDLLSAELEAKKIVEKFPDDPAAIAARLRLAAIYSRDGRLDEAAAEYQAILEKIPPTTTEGIRILSQYNDLLKRQQRYKEALALIDRYEKELVSSPEVAMNFKVARADIQTAAGETTEARALLDDLMGQTTNSVAQMQFRQLYLQTFARDRDTTGALQYLEDQIAGAVSDENRLSLIYQLAALQADLGNYAQARRWMQEATRLADETLKDELDLTVRTQTLAQLAQLYQQTGNLEGARITLMSLYESNRDPALGEYIVPQLFSILLRQNKQDEALAFLRDAQKRYSDPRLAEEAARVEDAAKAGKLPDQGDTSPLVLQFAAEPVITPTTLPKTTDTATTGATEQTVEQTTPSLSEPSLSEPAPLPTATDEASTPTMDATKIPGPSETETSPTAALQ